MQGSVTRDTRDDRCHMYPSEKLQDFNLLRSCLAMPSACACLEYCALTNIADAYINPCL